MTKAAGIAITIKTGIERAGFNGTAVNKSPVAVERAIREICPMNMMNTTARCVWTAVCVSALMTTTAFRASADEGAAPAAVKQALQLEQHTGIADSVDAKERRLVLRNVMFTKTFTLGDSCTCSFLSPDAKGIDSLRPGQKLTVGYQSLNGVRVAQSVKQIPMRYEGTVRAIDLKAHKMTLNTGAVNREMQLGSDCTVVLRGDKAGKLGDIEPGHHVLVMYDTPHGKLVARQIAQTSDTFEGSLTAIDLNEGTLRAESAFNSKKFNTAKNCTFVINGKTDGRMRDLKPGDKLVLSFDTVDGVNIVNRVATVEGPAESRSSK